MKKFKNLLLCLLAFAAIILTSCATPTAKTPKATTAEIQREAHKQRVIGLKAHMAAKVRLWNLSYKLTNGATSLCKDKIMVSGFRFITKDYFEGKNKDAAVDLYDLGELPKIICVIENSPAHEAGLEVGDQILSIEGKPLPTNPKKVSRFMESLSDNAVSLQMVVMRDGQRLPIELHRRECCNYGILLVPSDVVNAWADGKRVCVTNGMIRFVYNDLELATIVSHELAHNIRGHVDMTKKHQMVGGFLGLLLDIGAAVAGVDTGGQFTQLGMQAAQKMYSKDMEREADYVGLYILALSGYDFVEAPNVFRRWGASHPGSIETKYASTHPSTPERFVALEKAVEEIQSKKAEGMALIPEEKQTEVASRELEKEGPQEIDSDTGLRASKMPQTREEQLAHAMKEVRDAHEISRVKLRSTPNPLRESDIEDMIEKYNFFVRYKNEAGYFPNDFVDNGDGTVTDRVTALMWEKGGSPSAMFYQSTETYVSHLNEQVFAGYNDWRVPTAEELASLLEREPNYRGLHIASVFDDVQKTCWSSDISRSSHSDAIMNRAVDFSEGRIDAKLTRVAGGGMSDQCFLRAVRSID